MKIYLAAPLFTQAERRWNFDLATALSSLENAVILPQLSVKPLIAGDGTFDRKALFEKCRTDVHSADCILAILDGSDSDSGTAWECGYAYALGKPVIGVRTDFRLGEDDSKKNVNLMLAQSCLEVLSFKSFNEDVSQLAGAISNVINERLAQ